MSELKPCPFCGAVARITERPNNYEKTEFFCAIACFCDGYSARAHQMASANLPETAREAAALKWNNRAIEAECSAEIEKLRTQLAEAKANTEGVNRGLSIICKVANQALEESGSGLRFVPASETLSATQAGEI